MFEHDTYPPSFGPHNGEREVVLTPRSPAVSNHPPAAGPVRLLLFAAELGGDALLDGVVALQELEVALPEGL